MDDHRAALISALIPVTGEPARHMVCRADPRDQRTSGEPAG